MLPGDFLHRIAKRSCSPTTCERVIEPLIADLQREWLSADRPARRALARIRGYSSFWQTLLLCSARATPQMLATWPLPIAMRTAVMMAFCVAVVIGVGWFKTGGISWREGIREPNLVPFWLGLFWPMSDWWRSLAGARRLLPVVAFSFELAILCWLYPTRIDQIVIMSVTYAVVEYFIGHARTRGRKHGDQTRLGL